MSERFLELFKMYCQLHDDFTLAELINFKFS